MYTHSLAHRHWLCRDVPAIKLLEIIAGKNKPVLLRFSDDSVQQLPVYMDIVEAVDKLREAAGCGMSWPTLCCR